MGRTAPSSHRPRAGGGKVWPGTCRYAVSARMLGRRSPACRPSRLPTVGAWRQGDDRPHARRRILEPDGARAAAEQLAGDRQPESAATGVPVTRLVQPREPVEDALALGLRYAVPVVADGQLDTPRGGPCG